MLCNGNPARCVYVKQAGYARLPTLLEAQAHTVLSMRSADLPRGHTKRMHEAAGCCIIQHQNTHACERQQINFLFCKPLIGGSRIQGAIVHKQVQHDQIYGGCMLLLCGVRFVTKATESGVNTSPVTSPQKSGSSSWSASRGASAKCQAHYTLQ